MQDTHYPPEYKHGEVTFFGKKYYVTPDVLIPRLETEVLVRHARKILRDNTTDAIIDIGTGSGIIGVSCADIAPNVIFVDISDKAIKVAEKNYHLYFPNKPAIFLEGNLLKPILDSIHASSRVLVLTNLPYIREDDWENMSPDTRYEPRLALFGGEKTGFELYERLFEELQYLKSRVASLRAVIEFGYDQRDICEGILMKYGWKYTFFADYAGIERFCDCEIKN